MTSILVLNGPNLNLLGSREPGVYGHTSLSDIETTLKQQATDANAQLACFQSNAEFELIERIHQAGQDKVDFIIINPAAFTHTSVAIRDAILGVNIPFIEVHISNVHAREAFRAHSYFSDKAVGVICGLGPAGYEFALASALKQLKGSV